MKYVKPKKGNPRGLTVHQHCQPASNSDQLPASNIDQGMRLVSGSEVLRHRFNRVQSDRPEAGQKLFFEQVWQKATA
jgi:hypothetical protein